MKNHIKSGSHSEKNVMGNESNPDWYSWLICPQCRQKLSLQGQTFHCDCGEKYPCLQGVPHFGLSEEEELALGSREGQLMTHAYRKPNPFVVWLRSIVTSEYHPGKAWRAAQSTVLKNPPFLVVGSGTTHYPGGVHLDLQNFPGVDVVGDGQAIPFADQSFNGVICEVVLEHVREPFKLIDEIRRVLKPGGKAFLLIPWLFPFHGHPSDYRRWSREGIKADFSEFDEIEVGVHAGPCSAMVNLMSEWVSLALGQSSGRGYVLIKGLMTLALFPLKFLDHFFIRKPQAHRMAATLYILAKR